MLTSHFFFQIQGVVCLQEMFLCNTTHVCECTCVHLREWESCSKETLLALAAARCCLPASSSILEASRPHTDESQARTMAVWQLLCPGAAWKTATFSRGALRRRFWKARVQSLACLQSEAQHPHHERLFQSPRRTWGETERNVISSKPFDAWWAEFLMWGLRINTVFFPPTFPVMLCCLSLQSHLFSPVFYQQLSASSPVRRTVKCCHHEGADFGCESCVTTCAQTSPLCRPFGSWS